MEQNEIQALQIAASLLGGGAVGAAITAVIASYKARKLPIGKSIDVAPLFSSNFGGTAFNTSITVSDGSAEFKFPNLHLAEVRLVNRGNRDLADFTFGVTLSPGDKVVHVEPRGTDRHHVAELVNVCTPGSPAETLDFKLTPLNRRDSYTLRLFIVASDAAPGPIAIGTSEAVQLTEIPSVAEALAAAASSMSLTFGGIEVRVAR